MPSRYRCASRGWRPAASTLHLQAVPLVVDGDIYRHDFVPATVVDALMRVQLDTDLPVFSAVLARHFEVKEAELASAIAGNTEYGGSDRQIPAEPKSGSFEIRPSSKHVGAGLGGSALRPAFALRADLHPRR